jgi:hypothetical protein
LGVRIAADVVGAITWIETDIPVIPVDAAPGIDAMGAVPDRVLRDVERLGHLELEHGSEALGEQSAGVLQVAGARSRHEVEVRSGWSSPAGSRRETPVAVACLF